MESIVPALFSADSPTRTLLLLGTSAARPREAYELVFPPVVAPAAGEEQQQASTASVRLEERNAVLSRMALRAFVVGTAGGPEGTAAQREPTGSPCASQPQQHCSSGSQVIS